jgi:putative transposase
VRFIEAYRARFGVEPLCQVMGMAPSTYYYRRARRGRPSPRREHDKALLQRITEIWMESHATYGSPRVHAQLAREGIRVGRKRVERLMAEAELKGAYRSRYFRTTTSDPSARVAPDLVHRDFHPAGPNRLWVADFSAIRTDAGFVFLAGVLDAFSRVAVGWSTLEVRTVELIDAALTMALQRRRLQPGTRLIHHSDRGCQYTSFAYGQHLLDAGLVPSMGRKGDAYDNAMMESFFGTIKIELIDRRRWRHRVEVDTALLRYLEGWYNPRRLQRALGWRSPLEYEDHHHAGHDLTVPATSQRAPVLVGVKEQRLDPACGPGLIIKGGGNLTPASPPNDST